MLSPDVEERRVSLSNKLIKNTAGPMTLLRTSDYHIRSIDEERERILAEALEGAQRIRSEATEILTQAKGILAEAQVDAARMRQIAGEGAEAEGHARGTEKGLTEGRQQGIEEIRQKVEAEQAALLETLTRLHETLEGQRELLLAQGRHDLTRLAVRIAQIVCKCEVTQQEKIAQNNLEKAIELAAKRSDLEIRVHPDQLKQLGDYAPALARRLGRSGRITVVEDAQVGAGGCMVHQEYGIIDARLETQFIEIERQLLGTAPDGDDDTEQ